MSLAELFTYKISIITANYNRFNSIKNLYESIKKQTYKNWEWIICDDYSDLKYYHKVKELVLNDKRVKLIRNQKNKKQEYSRNKAIKLATGDIITNIDSDDDIPINRLEIINDCFEREKECDILYGGWTLVRGDKKTYFSPNPYNPKDFFIENRINNNATAWKRSCNLFYDEDYPNGCGDYSMWMCAIARGLRFMTADVNLVFWKNNPGCMSIDKKYELEKEASRVRYFWSKPRISVIMPTYNRTKYLKEAIKCVVNQTFKNWELLVVDDGSDINNDINPVKAIVDEFKDARIKYFRKENGGLSSALNYGLDRAGGDYIALLDDDDIWFTFHLDMLYKVITKRKEVGVVYGQTTVGEVIGNKINVMRDVLCGSFNNDVNKLLFANRLTTCSVLIDKSILYKNGLYFDETLKTHMDWDMWIRLTKYTKFLFLDIRSSIYRIHNQNMLAQNNNHIVGTALLSSKEDMGTVQMKHLKF